MTESERHNLDLLCVMKSVCVVPFCGQKIDSRKIPQELFKKGIQVPVPCFRTLVDSFVQDIRFSCHNLYSQHCCWAIFWFLYSAVFWIGMVFVLASRRNTDAIGIIMLLCYLLPLLFHLISCFVCRLWRKSNVYEKLGNMNHQLSNYNCMATVRNSKFGTAFFLTVFFYNISPCVDHLAGLLTGLPFLPQQQHHNVFGMNQITPIQPSTSEQQQQQQQQQQQPHQQQQQQQLEFYKNYAKSLLMSYSAEYLYLFLDDILPEVTPQRHTIQLCCLCQYVEYKTGGHVSMTQHSGAVFTV